MLIMALHVMYVPLDAMNFSDPQLPPLKPVPSHWRKRPKGVTAENARIQHSLFMHYIEEFTKKVNTDDLAGAYALAVGNQDFGRATLVNWARLLKTPKNARAIQVDLQKRTRAGK